MHFYSRLEEAIHICNVIFQNVWLEIMKKSVVHWLTSVISWKSCAQLHMQPFSSLLCECFLSTQQMQILGCTDVTLSDYVFRISSTSFLFCILLSFGGLLLTSANRICDLHLYSTYQEYMTVSVSVSIQGVPSSKWILKFSPFWKQEHFVPLQIVCCGLSFCTSIHFTLYQHGYVFSKCSDWCAMFEGSYFYIRQITCKVVTCMQRTVFEFYKFLVCNCK